eukprot:CAMPEP_0171164250 /NCGR_PEP_ID=MMETSP0790-20130122/5571_1 /TAXON_ID=2925 /ORGANISM="Alexandrium catenella, Strain OF101" /LENGTH=317 /DNA_ID=CAMNT_0011628999 /DNA_START=21 /DNA_END=974 /DNA_ORIENTATION=+
MVRVRQYNKRYFTIDFDSRVFFYSHAENSKKASAMIPFADLVDVRLPEGAHVDRGDNASECSKQSRVSWMRRMSTGRQSSGEEENVVTLMTKPAKTMELLCSSAAEAMQWFEAFKAAIADRGESVEGAGGSPCSLGVETPSSGEGAARDAGCAAAGSSDDVSGSPTGAAVASAAAASGAAEAAAPPPPVKGTFLDLGTEPEAPASPGGQAPGGVEEATIENLSPGPLEASQFGFDGEESSSAASSPPGTPRGGDGDGLGQDAAASGAQPGSRPATGRRSYADQHEGLSMKERLANLEFSDAEDDDDDPLGLGKPKAG